MRQGRLSVSTAGLERGGCVAPLPYRVGGGAPIARASSGFIALGSLTTSGLMARGAATGARSDIPRVFRFWDVVVGSVGDVVGLTRGSVVGLVRGTD